MTTLPEPELRPLEGPTVPTAADREEASRLLAALDEVPTAYRDTSPPPRYGPTPPVPQPGRPPMSSKAVDDTARMLGASAVIATTGGATAAVLWASSLADPVVVALVAGAPTVLVLALAKLMRGARPEPEVHHHYTGPVTQTTTHTETRGVWARTTNHK